MDVALTSEQQQWQEAAARLFAANAVTNPSAIPTDEGGRGWAAVLELGIPALRSPAQSGVLAAGVEMALAVEQAGNRLSPLPVIGQAVLAPELLEAAGAEDLVEAVVTGELRIAPAFSADLGRFGRLGEPAVAFDAAGATHALLTTGTGLVAVELAGPSAEGLDITRKLRRIDAGAAPSPLLPERPIAPDRLERAHALALTALAADLLGVMDGAVAEAVQYAKDRMQFGTPIGTFQAVQHLLADAAAAIEGARSCVWHAAWAGDHLDLGDAVLAARTAKAYCSEAGRRVVEATVQVFGGIAITWEQCSHVRLRRVHLDRECFGAEQVQHLAIAGARLDQAVA